MKIATWNVNSVKTRLPHLLSWLEAFSPDIVLLQEIKCLTDAFPAIEIEDLGFNVAAHGQKTYNGVAVLSRFPIEIERIGLPGETEDAQARYLEVFTGGVRAASIYLPNGNPTGTDKFAYKLDWMNRLTDHVKVLLRHEESLVLGGDYNVAPSDDDAYDPKGWADDALCHPRTRSQFRTLMNLGLTDAYRVFNTEIGRYSWWDYRGGAWNRDQGMRIDHLLLSPQATDRLTASGIDRTPRGWEKPSDHTPVWCDLVA